MPSPIWTWMLLCCPSFIHQPRLHPIASSLTQACFESNCANQYPQQSSMQIRSATGDPKMDFTPKERSCLNERYWSRELSSLHSAYVTLSLHLLRETSRGNTQKTFEMPSACNLSRHWLYILLMHGVNLGFIQKPCIHFTYVLHVCGYSKNIWIPHVFLYFWNVMLQKQYVFLTCLSVTPWGGNARIWNSTSPVLPLKAY